MRALPIKRDLQHMVEEEAGWLLRNIGCSVHSFENHVRRLNCYCFKIWLIERDEKRKAERLRRPD